MGKKPTLSVSAVVALSVAVLLGCTTEKSTAPPPPVRYEDLAVRPVDATAPTVAAPPVAAEPSPEEAVRRFVEAEVAGEPAGAYGRLASDDREVVRSPAGWQAGRAMRPRLLTFTPSEAAETVERDRATLRGVATFEPRLDEVVGMVPARAELTWTLLREDGGWRVAFDATRVLPSLPDAAGIEQTVRDWIDARRACQFAPAQEAPTGVVGHVELIARLCRSGPARHGPSQPLGDRPDPSPVLAAFGPDADRWARVVRVSGAVPHHLVLAPFAQRWVVIALLPSS